MSVLELLKSSVDVFEEEEMLLLLLLLAMFGRVFRHDASFCFRKCLPFSMVWLPFVDCVVGNTTPEVPKGLNTLLLLLTVMMVYF